MNYMGIIGTGALLVAVWGAGLLFHFFPLPNGPGDAWWAVPWFLTVALTTMFLPVGGFALGRYLDKRHADNG